MRRPDKEHRTIVIDECDASIFADGSILIETAEKGLLCLDFRELANLFLKAEKVMAAFQSES